MNTFWDRLDLTNGPDACWLWPGCRDKAGYGLVRYGGKVIRAHRVAFAIHNQHQLGREFICHRCDNPPCCNPRHLFIGDPQTNVDDMVKKGRHRCGRGNRHGWVLHPESILRGDKHPFSIDPSKAARGEDASHKLFEHEVIEIRRRFAAGGISKSALARLYNVTPKNIRLVVERRTWRHI